ncbi:hypothetical protein ERO13_A06G071900v2 [Gossypium hirsutum]|nr:hypothetical protein ERO13_A06G071900v2 [Gossypium hirsutum]
MNRSAWWSLIASSVSCFPVHALQNVEWPEQFPFKDEDFQRFNETPDSLFYEAPRFVTHIDDAAIAALTKYYSEVFPPSNTPGVSILDMCSSWVSHFPKGYKQERVVGMGMNEEELKRNPGGLSFTKDNLMCLVGYNMNDHKSTDGKKYVPIQIPLDDLFLKTLDSSGFKGLRSSVEIF